MIETTVADLCRVLHGRLVHGPDTAVVRAVSSNPLFLRTGDLYFALRERHADGHAWLQEAFDRGAGGVVVEPGRVTPDALMLDPAAFIIEVADTTRALGDLAAYVLRKVRTQVVAVTGSIGKTVVKAMIAHILQPQALVSWTERDLWDRIGLPLAALTVTGVEPYTILKLGGRRPQDIAYLTRIAAPQVCVVTEIGPARLQNWGAFATFARAKLALMPELSASAVLVLPSDDLRAGRAARKTRATLRWVGTKAGDDVRLVSQTLDAMARPRITLEIQGRTLQVSLNTHGAHHARYAALAIAATLDMVDDPQQTAAALATFQPLPHRLATVQARGITYISDFTQTHPLSVRNALQTVVAWREARKRVAVLAEHPPIIGRCKPAADDELGRLVASLGYDALYAIGRRPQDLQAGALSGGMSPQQVHAGHHALEFVDQLQSELKEGDCVLLKGTEILQFNRLLELLALR